LPGSAHDVPLTRTDRRLARQLIHRRRSPSYRLPAAYYKLAFSHMGQSFLPFWRLHDKGRRNRGMIRNRWNWLFERSCLNARTRSWSGLIGS
jgi:hypothetical protein